jgi:hypothetical protein
MAQGAPATQACAGTVPLAEAPSPAIAAAPAANALLVQPANSLAAPAKAREHRHALDKKFWALAGLTTALTTTDIEFTQHCLHTGRCVELDPFMPHSRAGMYLATYPANAAFFYWSFRRRDSGKRLWWLAPVIDIGSHAAGTWSGARFLR